MISLADFNRVVAALGDIAVADIQWSETISPPRNAEDFALEVVFIICNSGMKNTVAREIFRRCRDNLRAGTSVRGSILGKSGKAAAIDLIWKDRERLFREYLAAPNKIEYAKTLPWIGGITCYHVAKNFGADVAKPDVHLQRLADRYGCTAQELCADLARKTGYRISTIDTVIWRACANGVIDSVTGEIRLAREAAA